MHSVRFIPGVVLLSLLLFSCEKEEVFVNEQKLSHKLEFREDEVPSGPGETVLGAELANPYDIDNVNEAYELLTSEQGNLAPTHYYLKFTPTTGEHIVAIADYEEANDYEFDAQPLHFDVTYEGDEGYVDPIVGQGGFGPEYGAITASDYLAGKIPSVPFQLLNRMYIPVYESRLTFTAFVLSGNEEYYEAVDGLCHPDCPTWPDCLEIDTLTCKIDTAFLDNLETINPYSSEDRINFPDYILDQDLGYHGEIQETSGRNIPPPPDCDVGCIPELNFLGHHLYEWVCNCNPDIEETGGGGPPSGQTIKCGCYVYDNKKKPGGKITLVDTQLGDEGVRRIKVKTTKHYWGFIWRNTDTDDEGCWKIDKVYNVKRMKTKAVFKDRVSDRMVIRSFRGARFWNAFLKPVKHKWKVKRSDKTWHSLCLKLEDSNDNTSQNEESFVAATTNNAVHEFYDDHSSFQGPGKVKILIHTINQDLNTAPMFSEMDQSEYSLSDITDWFASHIGNIPIPSPLSWWWDVAKADVFLYFGDGGKSDTKKLTIYHEMTHVVQYTKLGASWWEEYVNYIIDVYLDDPNKSPYGDGTIPGAGRAEVAEGMAYAVGYYMADLQYGINHSRGLPLQNRRYMNLAETEIFFEAPYFFIPNGLFFDLFDENGVLPSSTIVTSIEPTGINDNVKNFTFEKQLNSLNSLIVDIAVFKAKLWQDHGGSTGTLLIDYNQLFGDYGH